MDGTRPGPEQGPRTNNDEQPCELRSLNVCDGQVVCSDRSRTYGLCFCAGEQLTREVGWTGAADGYAKRRSEAIAAEVLHPAGRLRRS